MPAAHDSSMPDAATIAVTGAAGSLARDVIPGLRERGFTVRGIDRTAEPPETCDEYTRCDIGETEKVREALRGVQAVVHLAGIPLEDDWRSLLEANVHGTWSVLEAARLAGVRRAVLASSIHATGFVPVPKDGRLVPDGVQARPNTLYGVSKAAVEALGSLYHDRHGLDVVCLRIASRFAEPEDARMLSTWLSPDDATRLFAAALTAPAPGFLIAWGVSANTRGVLSPDGGAALGYVPRDDAERFARTILGTHSLSEADRRYLGGIFCTDEPPSMASAR